MLQKTFLEIFAKSDLDDILGQDTTKKQLKSALISGHHVIVVGPPGTGKTTLAKNVARLLPEITTNDCGFNCVPEDPVCPACKESKTKGKKTVTGKDRFVRIQGSPDLTAEDLLGDIDPVKALKVGHLEAFTPGKIFKANNGVLFFDEVNRAPEKLQNALLQVLEEGKATIGSYSVDLPANLILIGTMNPEDTSTEPLSDVFLDRFDIIHMGYPDTIEIETEIVKSKGQSLVKFPEDLLNLMLTFIRLLREDKKLEKKPSVRASLNLYQRAQANAHLENRKKVGFSDIQEAVISVLSHRIRMIPSAKYLQSPEEYIREEFKKFAEQYSEIIAKAGEPG